MANIKHAVRAAIAGTLLGGTVLIQSAFAAPLCNPTSLITCALVPVLTKMSNIKNTVANYLSKLVASA